MKRNRLLQHSHLGNTQACFYNFCKLAAASFKHICGGYVASYPELPGCLTCADTLEEVTANALDAKKAWLEAALEDGDPIQEPESIDNYSGQFKLRMPKSLHKQLAEQSKKEGISMNQYCLYLLAQNNALHSA